MGDAKEYAALAEVISRIQGGDEKAQAELIDSVQARLFKFCLLLTHNREVAEDLCQDALLKALQNIKGLKNPETFWGWLYQVARNLFIDMKRKPANQNASSEEDDLAALGAEPEFDLILSVQKVLAQFDPEDRFLILLIELEGCSYKEAGDILHLSEDAVRSRLHRLRSLFIKKYNSKETK